MAIDTAAKRFSMLNFSYGVEVHLLFETDGTVDQDDRVHLLDLYGGIPPDAPPDNTKIDTQQKRMAVVGVARPWMRSVFPVDIPTEPWRHNVALTYANTLELVVIGGRLYRFQRFTRGIRLP